MTLIVDNLRAGYGSIQVLNGVTFTVKPGEIVTVLGRNGSGRSTTCKSIMGLLTPTSGSVRIGNQELAGRPAHEIARFGVGYVPEDRQIFRNLTVGENLAIGVKRSTSSAPRWSAEELCAVFPRLNERRDVKGGLLSGGEQQMLTLFRTLLGNPEAILVDEPTEGLAPRVVDALAETIQEMKRRGVAVVLLEQKLAMAMRLTDRVLGMGRGEIVFSGTAEAFNADNEVRRRWLEVH